MTGGSYEYGEVGELEKWASPVTELGDFCTRMDVGCGREVMRR